MTPAPSAHMATLETCSRRASPSAPSYVLPHSDRGRRSAEPEVEEGCRRFMIKVRYERSRSSGGVNCCEAKPSLAPPANWDGVSLPATAPLIRWSSSPPVSAVHASRAREIRPHARETVVSSWQSVRTRTHALVPELAIRRHSVDDVVGSQRACRARRHGRAGSAAHDRGRAVFHP